MTVAIGSMQRPPRVLLVCDWFLRYVVPYAIALHERGVDVALLCRDHAHEFNGSATEREHLLAGLDRAGVSVFEIPGRVRSLRAVRASVDVAAAVRRFRPDVVHAQSEIHDPRLLAAVTGYPTVLTVHDPELHWGTPPTYRDEP